MVTLKINMFPTMVAVKARSLTATAGRPNDFGAVTKAPSPDICHYLICLAASWKSLIHRLFFILPDSELTALTVECLSKKKKKISDICLTSQLLEVSIQGETRGLLKNLKGKSGE